MTFIQKLITIITILVMVSVAIAWSGLSGASSLNNYITELVQVEAKKITLLGKVARLSESCRKNEKMILQVDSVEEINSYAATIEKERAEMDKMLIEAKGYMKKAENKAIVENLQNDLKAYDSFIEDLKKLSYKSIGTSESLS